MTEKLEPFTLDEWRKRPGDLRIEPNSSHFGLPRESVEALGGVCVLWESIGPCYYSPNLFKYLRLTAPKPRLVEVRILKSSTMSFFGSAIGIYPDPTTWRTFYNMDTGEPIARVGVEG